MSASPEEMPFHRGHGIELSLRPFDELLAAGRDGLRLWELFRADDPEALLYYVEMRRDDAAPSFYPWNERSEAGRRAALVHWCKRSMVPQGIAPGSVVDEASAIVDRVVAELARRWPEVVAARDAALASPDPLTQWEIGLLQSGGHPNDHLRASQPAAQRFLKEDRVRASRAFPDAVYALLDEVLSHPGLKGLTHRGSGDWTLLRRACLEQLRRFGDIPRSIDNEFPVSVLAGWTGTTHNDIYAEPGEWGPVLSPYPAWARGIRFQFEGFILYDVYVEDRNTCGGWDHSVVDRRREIRFDRLKKEVSLHQAPLVVAGYDDPLRATFRHWLRHPSGWYAGVLAKAEIAGDLLRIVARHGFVMDAQASA